MEKKSISTQIVKLKATRTNSEKNFRVILGDDCITITDNTLSLINNNELVGELTIEKKSSKGEKMASGEPAPFNQWDVVEAQDFALNQRLASAKRQAQSESLEIVAKAKALGADVTPLLTKVLQSADSLF